MADWILGKKCPHCGGRMVMCEHFALTHDYLIRKDGKLSSKFRKSTEGAIDCTTAFCQECYTFWDGDNTICDNDGVWIRGAGEIQNR